MIAHLVKCMYAEAAHHNPHGDEAEQRIHGHSYKIEVLASGTPGEIGWVEDYAQLGVLLKPIYEQLDHAYLNEVPGLEVDTSLPAIERWILERIDPKPEWFDGIRVSIVGDCRLKITQLPEDNFQHLPDRILFTFEAAQSLPQLHDGHHCKCLHGHSYRVEVGVQEMDQIKFHIPAIYDALDHRYLNEVPGLEISTCEKIAEWIWEKLEAQELHPTIVVIQETPTARCLYYGE